MMRYLFGCRGECKCEKFTFFQCSFSVSCPVLYSTFARLACVLVLLSTLVLSAEAQNGERAKPDVSISSGLRMLQTFSLDNQDATSRYAVNSYHVTTDLFVQGDWFRAHLTYALPSLLSFLSDNNLNLSLGSDDFKNSHLLGFSLGLQTQIFKNWTSDRTTIRLGGGPAFAIQWYNANLYSDGLRIAVSGNDNYRAYSDTNYNLGAEIGLTGKNNTTFPNFFYGVNFAVYANIGRGAINRSPSRIEVADVVLTSTTLMLGIAFPY